MKTFPAKLNPLAACVAILLLAGASVGIGLAQEAPPPHKSPRVPVNRQSLETKMPARDVEGPATIVDGDHLRIGDTDLRLFGIVPPQLSASFGPQARAAVDTLVGGRPVACHIRDRDQAGHFLATCHISGTDSDLALELLRKGLAVTARGSIEPTELAVPYEVAEQAAEKQKLGLWSAAPPAAVSLTAVSAPSAAPPNAAVPPLPPVPPAELKKEEKPPETKLATAPVKQTAPEDISAGDLAAQVKAALPPDAVPPVSEESLAAGPGFFARYQLLIAGLLMLLTAVGVVGAIELQRRRDKCDELKATAAALRGELLAARAVCQARIKTWSEADDRSAAWPRIRSTLYQAYVGRLGLLGATLARQIASIYGQASDYSAYYGATPAPQAETPPPRKQALQTLERHIEEVLPRLAFIEQTGKRFPENKMSPVAPAYVQPEQPTEEASVEIVSQTGIASALSAWDNLKKFARDAVAAPENSAMQEQMPDYTSLIEEDTANFSLGNETSSEKPANVTKMRETGS